MRNPFIATLPLSLACAGRSSELSLLDHIHYGLIAILPGPTS